MAASGRLGRFATNPWDCAGHARPLPAPRVTHGELLRSVAQLLHGWPDETPLRLHLFEERYRRLINTAAGYPEVTRGSLPLDQPFHPRAAQALELTLALDGWPPLAGRHSLRAELLWLDRIWRAPLSRSRLPLPAIDLDARRWLRLVVAWLFAGLRAPLADVRASSGATAEWSHLLLDVLYDPDRYELAHEVRRINQIVSALLGTVRALRERGYVHHGFGAPRAPRGEDSVRDPGDPLVAAAEWLWAARYRAEVAVGRPESRCTFFAPDPDEDGRVRTIEVRFHRIQKWMHATPSAGAPLSRPEPRERGPDEPLLPLRELKARGASDLLEAILSGVRDRLLGDLGPGHLLVDGGGVLRFRCPQGVDEQSIETAVRQALDQLLWPGSLVGRRFAGVVERAKREAAFSAPREADASRPASSGIALDEEGWLVRLAWALLPPVSVTFEDWLDSDGRDRLVRVPISIRYTRPLRAPASQGWGAMRGSSLALSRYAEPTSLPLWMRMEIGVLAPRERLLRLTLREGNEADRATRLPGGTQRFRQYLVADLNRLGALFQRGRERAGSGGGHPDLEGAARRSMRFTVNWLLAIVRTAAALEQTSMPEILVVGGDDLVVGTRLPHGDLRAFAIRLHEELGRLNGELPDCDGVSFSAGLLTADWRGTGRHGTSADHFDEARALMRRAKAQWRREVEPPDVGPGETRRRLMSRSVVRIGTEARMTLFAVREAWSTAGAAGEAANDEESGKPVELLDLGDIASEEDRCLFSAAARRARNALGGRRQHTGLETRDGDARLEVVLDRDPDRDGIVGRATLHLLPPSTDAPFEERVRPRCCLAGPPIDG